MCGIAGIFNLDLRPCEESDVRHLIDAIAHRGPDCYGIRIDGPLGLGHRRLSILDPSELGKQPMQFCGRYWITYNGEIYNFVELRQELEALGVEFKSECDTEVVLAAYHIWGQDFLYKMNGMWAFAIWDSVRRELFLSRDRFGVKPLHYVSEPNRFVFSSELKSFLRLKNFCARENHDEVRRQFTTGLKSPEDTLLEGVKALRPGHNMLVSGSGVRIWKWWCTLDHLVDVPKRFSDQVAQFRELFIDACRLRMRSDVPIGTCLSGGLDSSSILCTLAASNKTGTSRLTTDYHRAFVATFPGTENDELQYAKAAIEKAGATASFYQMTPDALTGDLLQFAYDMEFIGHGLMLPVWAIYRELRRAGVVVSLDGLGADELLMGYSRSLRAHLASEGSLTKRPLRTLDLARTLHRQSNHRTSAAAAAKMAAIVMASDPYLSKIHPIAERLYLSSKSALPSARLPDSEWFEPWTGPKNEVDASEQAAMDKLTPMNRDLYWQFHHSNNNLLLRMYDRVSMAHGVEVRLPFLDWRLVTYCFSLPDESKIGDGYSKRILREAMRGILPEQIRTRTTKIGFQSPLMSWMNHGLGDWVERRSQTKHFLEGAVWNGKAIRDYIALRQREKKWSNTDARRIWRFMQADLWREAFFKNGAGHSVKPEFARRQMRVPKCGDWSALASGNGTSAMWLWPVYLSRCRRPRIAGIPRRPTCQPANLVQQTSMTISRPSRQKSGRRSRL